MSKDERGACRGRGEVGRSLWERTKRQPGMSEGKEAPRTSVPLVLVFLFDSLFLSLFLCLHLQRKCSYERLISSRVLRRLLRRPFARAWVCVCTRMLQKRHTPLPFLGHLPSPSQSCGTRGRFVPEIERI